MEIFLGIFTAVLITFIVLVIYDAIKKGMQ